jgi:type III secretion protein U
MSEEKNAPPTSKKLRDARAEGQVSHSSDLTDAVSMAMVIVLLALGAGAIADLMRQEVSIALLFISGDQSTDSLRSHLLRIALDAVAVILPAASAGAFGGVLASIGQVGFQISMKPVMPQLSKVRPASGLKRMFSTKAMTDLLKMTIKAAIIASAMWFIIESLFPMVVESPYQPPQALAATIWSLTLKVLIFATMLFVAVGVADAGLQKYLFLKQLRMSKEEIKRETIQSEGEPRIKAERKRIAKELATSPPPSARVGFANALIVNPTHYAVAIRFAPHEHPLPRVIAKGMAEQAADLRRAARDAQVPIVGNPPVARALYQVSVDHPIPEELFEAVAAILRWVNAIGAKQTSSHAH